MKRVILTSLTALASLIIANGAQAAPPIPITALPFNCNVTGGSYAFTPGITLSGTLTISADGVTVNMAGATINNGPSDGPGIYVNVSDSVVNGVQTNSNIVVKNGRVKVVGNQGVITSGWFNNAPEAYVNGLYCVGTVNGVTLQSLTILAYGGSVNCITDFGNGTIIKNCYLGNYAAPQIYPPFQDANGQWQYVTIPGTSPGYGIACYGNYEDVRSNNFSLVAIGNAIKYERNNVWGDTFENNNLGTAIPGVSGNGSDFANWIVPIPAG